MHSHTWSTLDNTWHKMNCLHHQAINCAVLLCCEAVLPHVMTECFAQPPASYQLLLLLPLLAKWTTVMCSHTIMVERCGVAATA
jgi:hypothetical protein